MGWVFCENCREPVKDARFYPGDRKSDYWCRNCGTRFRITEEDVERRLEDFSQFLTNSYTSGAEPSNEETLSLLLEIKELREEWELGVYSLEKDNDNEPA